jgi:ATP-binding protein involved in chromosome partitioning
MPDGSVLELFGTGGGQEVARALSEYSRTEVNLLAKVPISVSLREGSDSGTPLVASDRTDPAAIELTKIAKLLSEAKLPPSNRTLKVDIA